MVVYGGMTDDRCYTGIGVLFPDTHFVWQEKNRKDS